MDLPVVGECTWYTQQLFLMGVQYGTPPEWYSMAFKSSVATVLSFQCGTLERLGGASSRSVAWEDKVHPAGMEWGCGRSSAKVQRGEALCRGIVA